MIKSERLRLLKVVDPDLPTLWTDQDKLKQIVINLLSNAIKFTEAGTITVTARAENGKMAIAVADTGIGVPQDALELIFEEFRQVTAAAHGSTRHGFGALDQPPLRATPRWRRCGEEHARRGFDLHVTLTRHHEPVRRPSARSPAVTWAAGGPHVGAR